MVFHYAYEGLDPLLRGKSNPAKSGDVEWVSRSFPGSVSLRAGSDLWSTSPPTFRQRGGSRDVCVCVCVCLFEGALSAWFKFLPIFTHTQIVPSGRPDFSFGLTPAKFPGNDWRLPILRMHIMITFRLLPGLVHVRPVLEGDIPFQGGNGATMFVGVFCFFATLQCKWKPPKTQAQVFCPSFLALLAVFDHLLGQFEEGKCSEPSRICGKMGGGESRVPLGGPRSRGPNVLPRWHVTRRHLYGLLLVSLVPKPVSRNSSCFSCFPYLLFLVIPGFA